VPAGRVLYHRDSVIGLDAFALMLLIAALFLLVLAGAVGWIVRLERGRDSSAEQTEDR
jgi:hypothetical protein